jgi:hypothetical protein
MSDEQLAAIEARAKEPTYTWAHELREDRDALLALVREQQAAIERVREVHKDGHSGPVEPWAAGYKWIGHHCTHDGQSWPSESVPRSPQRRGDLAHAQVTLRYPHIRCKIVTVSYISPF